MPEELNELLEKMRQLRQKSYELYEEHLRVSAEYEKLKKVVDELINNKPEPN